MKKRFLMVIGLLFVLSLSACSQQNPLTKGEGWEVVSLNNQPVLADTSISLVFQKDSMGGSDGCNSYGGSYTSKGSELTFGNDTFSTMMYCSDKIQAQSTAYYQMLTEVKSYEISDGQLNLLDADGNTLAVLAALPLPE